MECIDIIFDPLKIRPSLTCGNSGFVRIARFEVREPLLDLRSHCVKLVEREAVTAIELSPGFFDVHISRYVGRLLIYEELPDALESKADEWNSGENHCCFLRTKMEWHSVPQEKANDARGHHESDEVCNPRRILSESLAIE